MAQSFGNFRSAKKDLLQNAKIITFLQGHLPFSLASRFAIAGILMLSGSRNYVVESLLLDITGIEVFKRRLYHSELQLKTTS